MKCLGKAFRVHKDAKKSASKYFSKVFHASSDNFEACYEYAQWRSFFNKTNVACCSPRSISETNVQKVPHKLWQGVGKSGMSKKYFTQGKLLCVSVKCHRSKACTRFGKYYKSEACTCSVKSFYVFSKMIPTGNLYIFQQMSIKFYLCS